MYIEKLILCMAIFLQTTCCAMGSIHKAIVKKDLKELEKLIAAVDVDINEQDRDGWTPLHKAVCLGSLEIVEMLIGARANVNIHDYADWTPLHWACKRGFFNIAKVLISAGAEIDGPARYTGRTPLHLAALNGYVEIVDILI